MRTSEKSFAVSALALAVQGALIAMCSVPLAAVAADTAGDEVKALVSPTNTVQVGAVGVSKDSGKFGEYNGLNTQGTYLIGNINLRGGDAYGMGDGTTRWEITGRDLGTMSRSAGASVSSQGRWSVGIGYDELRHQISDTYQTPYQGTLGGNTFTLNPTNFGVVNTSTVAGSGTGVPVAVGATGWVQGRTRGTWELTPSQLASINTVDVHSDRKTSSFNAGFNIDRQWSVKLDFSRVDQSGAKLIGSGTDPSTGTGPNGSSFGGERIAVLLNPTKFQTDNYSLALNWIGDKAHLNATYFNSKFHDDYTGISFSNPFVTGGSPVAITGTAVTTGYQISTMSTPPSNDFHQFKLSGGYAFSPATKLAGGLSYSRNTQNESYAGTYTTTPLTIPASPGLPVASLNGLVESTHADFKLTHQATKDLGFVAAVKYNERDNKTASNSYTFLDEGAVSRTVVNSPMSNKRYQIELAGDYRIDAKQRVRVGYEYDNIKRWCNNALANNAQGVAPNPTGTTLPQYYGTTASCVQIPENKESKLALAYKIKASETVDFDAAYSYADRKADVNPAFYNPLHSETEGYENFGYRAYFDAARKQDLFKTGVSWQATDAFNLTFSGRYTKDKYGDSPLGVQKGDGTTLNLDGTYAFSENNSLSAYVSWQKRERDLSNAAGRNAVALITATVWSNNLKDADTTIGVSGKQKGFAGGKLEFAEDINYSFSKTDYTTLVPYTLATCTAANNGSCGALPDIRSETFQFKFSGGYQVDKVSKITMGYMFQRLKTNDYYYDSLQYGYTPTSMLPTNQQAPRYTINTVFAAYTYSFQ